MGNYSFMRLILFGMSAFACVQIGTRASLGVVLGVGFTAALCMIWGKTPGMRQRSLQLLRKWAVALLLLFSDCFISFAITLKETMAPSERPIQYFCESFSG